VTTTVLLTGVGGQGTILASDVLAKVAAASGLDVKLSEVHGMSQRGGSVDTAVRFGEHVYSPVVDAGAVDVMIAFELLEGARWAHFVKQSGRLFVNTRQIDPLPVMIGEATYPDELDADLEERGAVLLDADALACEAGSPRSTNIVMLGALSTSLEFSEDTWNQVIEGRVPSKTVEANLRAFELGRDACASEGRCCS
jgi:indolepyruvate ferredoxin oxidoreductase beta subunit